MISHTSKRFRKAHESLPEKVQKQAKAAYKQFKENPYYPSLDFKRVHSSRPIYSIRISKNYRALGTQENNTIIWFWIGSHADYEKLLKQLT